MTAQQFVWWLQGSFEIQDANWSNSTSAPNYPLSALQVDVVRRHLALVFAHEIDPSMGDQKHQSVLNDIHSANTGLQHLVPTWSAGKGTDGKTLYRC